jgi:hypothetical protein
MYNVGRYDDEEDLDDYGDGVDSHSLTNSYSLIDPKVRGDKVKRWTLSHKL